MGESSRSSPWPGGIHRARSHPIGIYTNPSLGTGFADVLAHAVAAGIMASSRGSARAACAPFRNVRLGIAFFVINITLSFFLASGSLCSVGAVIDRPTARILRIHTISFTYWLQMLHSFERSAFETERSSRFQE